MQRLGGRKREAIRQGNTVFSFCRFCNEDVPASLKKYAFCDEQCRTAYISNQTGMDYNPTK